MHFLTLFYVSVLASVSADYAIVISVSASVSANMKIRYIGGYQFLWIWKNAYQSPTSSMYKCIVRMLIADAESFPTQKYIVMGWYLLMEYAEITLHMGLTPK